ncbi:Kynureninase (L-kynurenine hydrolase), partial [Spiromyces aspiralis]
MEYLQATSAKIGLDIADLAFAVYLDNQDPLAGYHNEFVVPTLKEAIVVPEGPSSDGAPAPDMASGGDATGEVVYLCGNSLGLLPKRSKQRVEEELGVWGAVAVIGHHRHQFGRPWVTYMDELVPKMAPL